MAIIHYSEKQKGITFIVWDGKVVWDDWIGHAQQLMADPDWRTMPRFIADLQSVVDTSTIQLDQVEMIADILAANREALTMKKGAVVASEEFWRAQKFGELLKRFGTSTIVFNTLDTACLFLGIDPVETNQTIEKLRAQLRSSG